METRGCDPPCHNTIHQSSAPPVLSSKCVPPKSPHPHPRLFYRRCVLAHLQLARLPPGRLPSRLQAPCRPIDLQCSLDPISLNAFTTCTSSRLFLMGRTLLPSPTSPALPTCGVHRSIHLRCSGFSGGATSSISFFGILSFFDYDYDLQYFRLCIILYQVN